LSLILCHTIPLDANELEERLKAARAKTSKKLSELIKDAGAHEALMDVYDIMIVAPLKRQIIDQVILKDGQSIGR
jgi:hypothetical protein